MKQKLHSRSGASFIVALLVMFICLMVGAVVLAAASAGIQHIRERRDEQQEYLSLSSASELVTKGVTGVTFETVTTRTTYACNRATDVTFLPSSGNDPHPDTESTAYDALPQQDGTAAAALRDQLAALAESVDSTGKLQTAVFTIAPDSANTEMQTVQVELTMDPSYALSAQLSLPDGKYSSFYLQFTPSALPSTVETHQTDTHKVKEQVEKNGKWTTVVHDKDFDVTVSAATVSVTWSFDSFTKGAAS